ncbi:hypothetical protein, partial [Streptomyces cyaneofuscatus]|uniref:hypothetical protein n=1 Tax=Streptomyces cyaneofuscatus TaxID=66883 RepID=UPI002FF1153F
MRNPVQASPRFGEFKSYDKVASRLLASHPDVFYKPGKSKEVLVRSLGAKIGELDRGKTAWWLKREREMQCLIDLLEIERDDLGLYQKSGKHIVALPVFPDFPPLDLQRENYWSIAAPQLLSKEQYDDSRYAVRSIPKLDAWFSARGHISSDTTLEWLHVPDKTEYQLLTEKLDATGRHQFIGHPSVREALVNDIEHVHSQQPLVLAIHENPEADHVNVLLGYRQGAPLLVISPFPMPTLWTKDAEEDEKDGKSTEPASPEKDIPAGPDDVRNWIWT